MCATYVHLCVQVTGDRRPLHGAAYRFVFPVLQVRVHVCVCVCVCDAEGVCVYMSVCCMYSEHGRNWRCCVCVLQDPYLHAHVS